MITLRSTKKAFEAWRAARANTATPIPAKLWEMVQHLLLTHQKSIVCKVLRLSGGQIKKHCNASINSIGGAISNNKKVIKKSLAQKTSDDNDFVTAMPLPIAGKSSTCELTLKGISKSLHLCLPISALRDILPMLGELL